ncbi:hypothetical protein BJ508DRAFT_414279 [Ascobolus immersus RN42]|uniref:Uncharacterized protein n=1 Tax=Ascobolus immersus RN42 TaxID=1160509 RepID=A0A3N4I850_ASCIM|nr:hypothetical protein BJ508DRAFT_414279 [Ascobolus immersus RN42]
MAALRLSRRQGKNSELECDPEKYLWMCAYDDDFTWEGCCSIDPCMSNMNAAYCWHENPDGLKRGRGVFTMLMSVDKNDLATTTRDGFTKGTFKPTAPLKTWKPTDPETRTIPLPDRTPVPYGVLPCRQTPISQLEPSGREFYNCDYGGIYQPFGGCCSNNACEKEALCRWEVARYGIGLAEGVKAPTSRGPFDGVSRPAEAEPTVTGDPSEDINSGKAVEDTYTSPTSPANSNPANPPSTGSNDNKTTIGIAAGVSAGVLVLGIIGAIIFFLIYKKRKREREGAAALAAAELSNDGSYSYGGETKPSPGSQRSSGWFSPGKGPASPIEPSIPAPISELDDTTTTSGSPKVGPPRYSGLYNAGKPPQAFEMADNSVVRGPNSPLIGQGPISPTYSDGGSQWGGTNTVSEISEVDGRERSSRAAYGGNLGPVDEKS